MACCSIYFISVINLSKPAQLFMQSAFDVLHAEGVSDGYVGFAKLIFLHCNLFSCTVSLGVSPCV